MDIGLHRDVDLRALPVKTRQPRKTIERVPDGVQARQRDLQRALLFGLADNLVDPRPQLEIAGLRSSLEGRQAIAAVPRDTSFIMALDDPRPRQFDRCRCRLDGFSP